MISCSLARTDRSINRVTCVRTFLSFRSDTMIKSGGEKKKPMDDIATGHRQEWWKQISIEPVVFLYMLAIYLNVPTDEALLYRQVCLKLYHESLCNTDMKTLNHTMEDRIQKYASTYGMYFNLVYSIPTIFTSILCGTWSDRYSYRIPMMLANMGCILATIVNLFASIRKYHLSIEILFLSNLLISLFGSTSTMFSIVYNYILHVSSMANRTQRLGIVESCFMFGSTFGLLASGFLLDLTNFQLIFVLIIVLHLLNMVYIFFGVREVIPIDETLSPWKHFYGSLFIWNNVRDSFRMLCKRREHQQRKCLLLALLGLLCSM